MKKLVTIIAVIFFLTNKTFAVEQPTLAEVFTFYGISMPDNFGFKTKKTIVTTVGETINITINNKKLALVPVGVTKSYKIQKQEPEQIIASVAVLKKSEMIIPAKDQISTSALTVKKPYVYESLISSNDSLLLLEGLTSIYQRKSHLVGNLIYRTKRYVSKSFSVKENGDEKTFSVNETKGFYKNFMVIFRDGSNVISYRGNLGDKIVNEICLDEYFITKLQKRLILIKDTQLVMKQ